MRSSLILVLVATVLCLVTAKHGSISDNLFESDVKDDFKEDSTDEGTVVTVLDTEHNKSRKNPCVRKKCYRGEICQVNEAGDGECVCNSNCEFYRGTNERHKVCSNKNVTYETECDLDREHCLCKYKKDGCNHPDVKKIQLEYYGQCQELGECVEGSRIQFPDRMRTWLFVVMETMANRAEMGEYEVLLEEAKADANHSFAAIWGFCDLDKDPQDRFVSRRELQKTVRSLKVFENCLVPFLDDCDEDDDRKITLVEWGKCLNVPHDKITDRCKDIHEKRENKVEK